MQTAHTSIIQTIFRILLGLAMVYAGIGHLTFARLEFTAQVPKWLPMNEDLVVVLSGIVEITLGLALAFLGKYKVYMGWILAVFYVLVFPGNISQYTNHINAFHLDSDTARLIRLFFQPVLICWALWSTGAWSAWRNAKV
jgi:uncharacterized membrane protein